MRIDFHGRLEDKKEIKAGFIGCGSHSFRNIYPVFQYVPIDLLAVCDLDAEKAKAFARKFGAKNYYSDYRKMLANEELDAVFIVTGYDKQLRPLYPKLAMDCLKAGCHVWIEKPPAASCSDIESMQQAEKETGKHVMVGLKKMFFPANIKAKELTALPEFGDISLVLLQYPQHIPTVVELDQYINHGKAIPSVMSFLDHLCHPLALLIYLLGYPSTLYYDRSPQGSGALTFGFDSGPIASLALTTGSSSNGGMERTTIVSDKGKHIIVDNNIRVSYHQGPPNLEYGASPSFYSGNISETTSMWEPEFSLGNLYNKGLFLLGYFNEIQEFAHSVLENRAPTRGTLEEAWHITRVFEKFILGPQRLISFKG